MLHFDEITFGPILSRRLGASLGVNILPREGKTCNFDCVYCECGWNRDGISRGRFPGLAEVREALERKLSKVAQDGTAVDSITFSGNGEPALNPDFARIIDATLELRDKYFPEAQVSVLSNASLIGRDDVFRALMKVDNAILKLDAPTDALAGLINKPAGKYRVDDIIEGMKRFDGHFVLQTMFLKSPDFDVTAPDSVAKWREIVRMLRPRRIMVYTIDRETPDKSLAKCTADEMAEYVRPLAEDGFDVQISG